MKPQLYPDPRRLPRPGIACPLVALGGGGEVLRQPGDDDRGRGRGTLESRLSSGDDITSCCELWDCDRIWRIERAAGIVWRESNRVNSPHPLGVGGDVQLGGGLRDPLRRGTDLGGEAGLGK